MYIDVISQGKFSVAQTVPLEKNDLMLVGLYLRRGYNVSKGSKEVSSFLQFQPTSNSGALLVRSLPHLQMRRCKICAKL